MEIKLNGKQIQFEIKNSIVQPLTTDKKNKGVGIENLKRRLELLYLNKHDLKIKQTENMFGVKLTIHTN